MALFTNMIKNRSRLSVSITAVAALLLLSFLIPFSYNKTIGYEVAFAGVDRELALEEGKIQMLLTKLGIDNAEVNVSDCEQTCTVKIKSLKTTDDAQLVVAAFDKINNVVSLQNIKEEIEVKTGNIFNKFVLELKSDDNTTHDVAFFTDKVHLQKMHNVLVEKLGDNPENEIYFTFKDSGTEPDFDFNTNGENKFYSKDGSATFEILTKIDDGSRQLVLHKGTENELVVDIPSDGTLDKQTIQLLHEHGLDVTPLDNSEDVPKDHVVRIERVIKGDPEIDENGDSHAKESGLPEGFILNQNYPNPFNPTTTISFVLPQTSRVTLDIININGQKVKTLIDRNLSVGEHSFEWDATNESGQKVASGVYLYRLSTPDFSSVKKMTLMK